MNPTTNRCFNTRAFVACVAAFSGLGLPVTGIANHLHQFEPMNPARHAWMAAHNTLGLLFLVFVAWHAILNWRLLKQHLRGLARRVPTPSREAVCAAAAVAAPPALLVAHAFVLR